MSGLAAWVPRAKVLGAYLHIPFCTQRCGYCSFNTAPDAPGAVARFVPALLGEIDLAAKTPWAAAIRLKSVFLGGGTPSLLPPEAMAAILDRLRANFPLEPSAEITVECNPESVSVERLTGYRHAGVTRISLGVQSLDDRILPTLDRLHTAAQAREAFDAARAAGFSDVSADLIYGLPGLDLPTWEATVKGVLGWQPDHLSAYALTLDEGSLWHARDVSAVRAAGRRGAGPPPAEASEPPILMPPEETTTAQYRLMTELAAEAGFEHYEVSNYARPGHRSAHNQIYWRAEEYLGFGPGACGYLGDVRYANVKPVDRWAAMIAAGEAPVDSHEALTPRQRMAERLMLGLRMREGVPAQWMEERAAVDGSRLRGVLAAWTERGLLVTEGGRARLTEPGFLLSDALFMELL
ncbi:MAG TPA: radical SAM family heme chaperone HemW [Methylomirabilota bacterium]|nr:radical SAM family heme chaperone HemW [Methylomirabilota bacterium]